MTLKSPAPYFGGKSQVAPVVWARLGDVPNYVEPFAGMLAVLLARPHHARTETINDLDGFVSNFWRAVSLSPETARVAAQYADWPVIENDLHARHKWLRGERADITRQLEADPFFCDPRAAGWWVWGLSCWIGGGWCDMQAKAPRKMPKIDKGVPGVYVRPAKREIPTAMAKGVNARRIHLACGEGVHNNQMNSGGIYDYFLALQARMRRVRVVTGHWDRILGPTPTTYIGLTGIFLDPPYGDTRDPNLYATDSLTVAKDVRAWAIAHGDDPQLRIALCGHDDYDMPEGWTVHRWKAPGGYARLGKGNDGRGHRNRAREVIWFSRNCLNPQPDMFDSLTKED